MKNQESLSHQPEQSQAELSLARKRITELIEFIANKLKELNQVQDQERLLYFILRAIAEEENLDFSHSFYTLADSEQGLTLADNRYPESDISQVITHSLNRASGTEKKRYQLELKQFEQLLAMAKELLNGQDLTGVTAVGLLQGIDRGLNTLTAEKLSQLGFQPAVGRVAPEIARDYQVDLEQTRWVGPKWAYTMPPSKIHPGGKAVLTVAQPTYLSQQTELGLQQTQLLVDLDEQQLAELLSSFSENGPIEADETALMSHLVKLPDSLSQASNVEAINTLLQQANPNYQPSERVVNDDNVQHYARLVRQVFSSELTQNKSLLPWKSSSQLDTEQQQRLADFIYHVVFKGLKNQSFLIDDEQTQQIAAVYHQQKSSSGADFTDGLMSGLGQTGFAPAFSRVFSVSQCVGFAPLSGIKPSQLANLSANGMSMSRLSEAIGSERAKLWETGICQQCGAKTLVGECGICLRCELMQGMSSGFADGFSREESDGVRDKAGGFSSAQGLLAIGLAEFVSGEDKSIVSAL